MRIISKFHDYYDSAQAQGQDKSLVFVRQSEQFAPAGQYPGIPGPVQVFHAQAQRLTPGGIGLPLRGAWQRVDVAFALLLFAGKLFPFAEVKRQHSTRLGADAAFMVYDYAELDGVLSEHGYDLQSRNRRDRAWLGRTKGVRAPIDDFFALRDSDQLMLHALEHKLPVLSWRRQMDLLDVNPRLADFQFYRVLDAWQAYQELSMFLGNIAAPERHPVVIEDKFRIQQHGFDKWSFRKPPQH